MKCRACWSESAEVWQPGGWRGLVARVLLLAPVKCRHCLHRSWVPLWSASEEALPAMPGIAAGTVLPMARFEREPRRAA